MDKVELLAPAGDLEKLKYAIEYGADAVYMAGEVFGLRTSTKNFSYSDMLEAIEYVHKRNKKVYLVLNIIAHNEDIDILKDYLESIKELNFDAYIISDPGIFKVCKDILGEREYHLSTQANSTNFMSSRFWFDVGFSRIILARELSLEEIELMCSRDKDIEYEVFVHGAMCMAYSGRCLISNYLTGRGANQGDCSQACRWNYSLVENKRQESFPIEEDERGTYFFNSKDLCTLPILSKIIETGVKSLKIEGRNKSPYYVASVVRVYRKAIDDYYNNIEYDKMLLEEVKKVSHRYFTTGFYEQNDDKQVYSTSSYIREYDFLATVEEYDEKNKIAKLIQRNKFSVGDEIEIIGPGYKEYIFRVNKMFDKDMKPIESCPHAKQIIYIECDKKLEPMYLVRRKRNG